MRCPICDTIMSPSDIVWDPRKKVFRDCPRCEGAIRKIVYESELEDVLKEPETRV